MSLIKEFAVSAVIFAATLSPFPAVAATVGVTYTQYAVANVAAALTARDAFIGSTVSAGEDFEKLTACSSKKRQTCASGTVGTAVGTFTGFGGSISNGGSQVQPKDQIVVRTSKPDPYGRYNVTPGGKNWLDSNDREGIFWTVMTPGDGGLTRLAFLLTDVDDVGTVLFNIVVNGNSLVQNTATRPAVGAPNGTLHLVTMLFDAPTDGVTITMISGTGDGYGIDGIRLSAVPLPAGMPLLLAGLGGLALLRRRRAA